MARPRGRPRKPKAAAEARSSAALPALVPPRVHKTQYAPTPEGRRFVAERVAIGVKLETIAFSLGLTVPALKRHYTDEIEHGLDVITGEIGERVIVRATLLDDPRAQEFFLDRRRGWTNKEADRNAIAPDHEALRVTIVEKIAQALGRGAATAPA